MVLHYASKLFWKRAPAPANKKISHGLMLANGMIYQTSKGQFAFLPNGTRVLNKITKIIDDELAKLGAQKCALPFLGAASMWKKSGRWDLYGNNNFRLKDRNDKEFCLQPTGEEMITQIAADFGVFKGNSLPVMLYQTTDKFRDEERPEFGVLRSSQFVMNDLYSFDKDLERANNTYKILTDFYHRFFYNILGMKETLVVKAETGEIGGDLSHEYHFPSDSAQDKLTVCKSCQKASLFNNETKCQLCNGDVDSFSTIEVGHTFRLGTKYSEVFEARSEEKKPYVMCCFGLGVSRIIGACIDVLSTSNKAMRLPYLLSPYKVAIVLPKTASSTSYANEFGESILNNLDNISNVTDDILVEDCVNKSVGQRLHDLNQLGVPHIFVVQSKKSSQPTDPMKIEYFRTQPHSDELQDHGVISHSHLFSLLKLL